MSISFYFQRAGQRTTFDDSQLVTLLFDLFMAGTDTTSNTLRTLTLYLMTHTHIQGKECGCLIESFYAKNFCMSK